MIITIYRNECQRKLYWNRNYFYLSKFLENFIKLLSLFILYYNLIIFGTIVKRIIIYTKKFYWRNFMDWNEIQNVLSNAVFGILLIAMVIYWVNLLLFNDKSYLSTFGRISTSIATLFLFFILCSRWVVAGYFPLSNLYESLLFLTWILLAAYLYIETKTGSRLIGAIVVPITLLISGFANLTLSPEMQKSSPLVPALQSNWLMMHVSMMLLSYGTLIMGSLLCILFLVISGYKDVDLKSTDTSSSAFYNVMVDYYEAKLISSSSEVSDFGKLKLLQSIDNWSYRIIGLGFPFLTIGIISGGVWANEAWGSYWSWDPKETWALITWLVFATYLHARITKGWEGKKTALLGGLGFFVIWICYLGVNFLGKGLHSYGWVS